jgi:HD-GYP domain-containing protein (c-di-GMP phosphodiesterase class II)
MVLGKSIYHSDGRILLAKGATLNRRHLQHLRELDIRFLYVDDGRYGEVVLDQAVADETRAQAVTEVRRAMDSVATGSGLPSNRIAQTIVGIIDELLSKQGSLISLTDIRAMRDYTFAHSAGVAVVSLTTGLQMGLERPQLVALGMGALLHDLGKSLVSPAILNKPDRLSALEFDALKRHAELGYRLLLGRTDLEPAAAVVAREHHERLNGTGYPQGLAGDDIHLFARIAAVADVFDAMSTDRVYRWRHLPHETSETLIGGSGILFAPMVVKAFCEAVAVYPVGTVVRLTNGLTGVVIRQNKAFPGRPVVRVRVTEDGRERLADLDLASRLTLFIAEVIVDQPV